MMGDAIELFAVQGHCATLNLRDIEVDRCISRENIFRPHFWILHCLFLGGNGGSLGAHIERQVRITGFAVGIDHVGE